MVKKHSNEVPGFARHWQNASGDFIFLPLDTVAELEEAEREAELAAAEAARIEGEQKTALAEELKAKKLAEAAALVSKAFATKPGPRDVEIFTREAVEEFFDNQDRMESSNKQAVQKIYDKLINGASRYRTIPQIKPANIRALASQFENMAAPIKQLADEIELMNHLPAKEFQLTPILLLGEPGIGKTAFAMALAKVMGLPFKKLNGAEPSFSLTGSHPTWTKAAPGMVITQLATQQSAAPLFLVDEIDKPSGDRYAMDTALLDLLEPENAREFKDEFLQINCNARHALWILTANTTTGVSDPLLSRMSVFDIPRPGITQRKRIIKADFKKLRQGTGINVNTTPDDVMSLAKRVDLDLRAVTKIVRSSFIAALGRQSRYAEITLPPASKTSMGFY
jgi:ATP-dependent Lon protease